MTTCLATVRMFGPDCANDHEEKEADVATRMLSVTSTRLFIGVLLASSSWPRPLRPVSPVGFLSTSATKLDRDAPRMVQRAVASLLTTPFWDASGSIVGFQSSA